MRTPDGWITVPWTHLPMVSAPFAEFTWRHARKLAAARGVDHTNETEVAKVLHDLLSRAQAGQVDKATDRVAARTRVASAAHRPPPREDACESAAASELSAGGHQVAGRRRESASASSAGCTTR